MLADNDGEIPYEVAKRLSGPALDAIRSLGLGAILGRMGKKGGGININIPRPKVGR
jgi:hypothetical protein